MKEKVFVNNPHTLQELKDNIRREINLISSDEFQCMSQNVLERCETCICQDCDISNIWCKGKYKKKNSIINFVLWCEWASCP